MPKVSIIVPNYNHAKFLSQRLDSICDQTFTDFELILLDDHSSDNSVEILARYAQNPKVSHLIVNGQNTGSPFQQWQKGVRLAVGEYIWIAESDDWAEPEFLAQTITNLEKHPTAGLAYCESWVVDDTSKRMHPVSQWIEGLDQDRWKADYFNTGKNECAVYLISQNYIFNASAVLFKKEVFEKAFENTPLRLAGDWLLWANMLLNCDLCYLAQPLNNFRWHRRSVRNNPTILQKELQEVSFVIESIRKRVTTDTQNVQLAYQIVVNRLYSRLGSEYFSSERINNTFPDGTALPNELLAQITRRHCRAKGRLMRAIQNFLKTSS